MRFSVSGSEEPYRERLDWLHRYWARFNEERLGGRMQPPHILFTRTAPRSLGHCEGLTGYGGRLQITLNEGLVFGTNHEWVVRPWPPAIGTRLFIQDLLERLAVRQFVLEILEAEEAGYRGFGPLFTVEANRIGLSLGLGPVVAHRRYGDGPLATGWPHSVWLEKDPRRYGDDVTEALLDLATGNTNAGTHQPPPPSLGLLELLLWLLREKKIPRAEELLIRHIDRLQEQRTRRYPVRRRMEDGLEDTDGSPLGKVEFQSDWLAWNNGTVRKVAQSIYDLRAFAELPILADVLEEAGCSDGRILRHLREKVEHTRRCWCLRRILAVE